MSDTLLIPIQQLAMRSLGVEHMRFPDSILFELPFFIALGFGGLATVLYYWIVGKLQTAGVQPPIMLTLPRIVTIFRTYRQLSSDHGWPAWPVIGFWISIAVMFAAGIVMAIGLQR